MKKLKLKFISIIHRLFPNRFCWTDCVAWVYSKRINPMSIDKPIGCRIESLENNACYCGHFIRGKHCSRIIEAEIEAIRKEAGE